MRVAIIPARGGSKRIPGKNIRTFCAKPMIAYSIEAAQKSGVFDRIVVSTDDEEIMEVACHYGAEAPFVRPSELSDDYTTTVPVIAHAIGELQKENPLSAVCCIYATAPFVQPESIARGYELLLQKKAQYAFSVTTFPFPVFRAIRLNDDGGVEMLWPEYRHTRSQDLPEAYHDAGQFYWGVPEAWLENKPIFAPHSVPVILPRHLVQDIDTLEDWKRAELMYRSYMKL